MQTRFWPLPGSLGKPPSDSGFSWFVAVLLLASVVALPLLIKDDGTARGFTKFLLTYTLATISALLGVIHSLAGMRHARAGYRGMPSASVA
jgi:hypothetical protein